MSKELNNMLSSVRTWALSQGMKELCDKDYTMYIDCTFQKEGKKIGFITEFDKDENTLKLKSISAKERCDYVYIVTDDTRKRRELLTKIMPEYGILCYSDSFGLGYLYQVLREPKIIR